MCTLFKIVCVFTELRKDYVQSGAYPGGMHRMHVHPPPLPVHPPRPCASPPQPERLVMRKDEAVGNKKKCKFVNLNIIIN
jgi:hypothetical protein